MAAGGTFTYGTYPDIEGLIREQAGEVDPKRREATLQRIQQLIHDKAMFAPIWQLAFINGYGPRMAESGLALIAGHPYSAPYEDVKLSRRPEPLTTAAGERLLHDVGEGAQELGGARAVQRAVVARQRQHHGRLHGRLAADGDDAVGDAPDRPGSRPAADSRSR